MSEKNFVCCITCKTYIPLHLPGAAKWAAHHDASCKEWGPAKTAKVQGLINAKGEHVKGYRVISAFSWEVPETSISYREDPPEGYTCGVGAMEELAFSLPPPRLRLGE